MKNYIFTSESVTEGHPDKVCDQIADAILDAALEQDPYSNMAVECTIKDDFVLIYGEANTKANIDYAAIALAMIKKIGYEEEYHVHVVVNQQSPERSIMRSIVMMYVLGIKESCLAMHVMKVENICHCQSTMHINWRCSWQK